MLVTLILPQLIFQYLGDGKAYNGKNWQGWRGGFKQYQDRIDKRYTTDKDVLDKLISDGVTNTDEIKKCLGGASIELQNFGASVGYAIPKMKEFNEDAHKSAHPLQNLKTNIKGVAKEIALAGIQFAAFVLASWVIELGVNWVDSLVNALKYAKEAAENLNKAYEDMNTTQKQNTKTVEEYGKTWEKLKDGVDKQGKNVSLSDDEYEQYKESINQIINILPGIASGWDDNNNAILLNVQSMDELNQKMEEYAQKQRELILSGDETKSFKDKAKSVDLEKELQTLGYAQDLVAAIKSGNTKAAEDVVQLVLPEQSNPAFWEKSGLWNILTKYNLITDSFTGASKEAGYTPTLDTNVYQEGSYEHERIVQALSALEDYITTSSETVGTITQGMKDLQSIWTTIQFSSADSVKKGSVDFNTALPEAVQNAIQSFMNNQGGSFYAQFDGDVDKMYSYLMGKYTEVADSVSDEATKAYQKAVEQWQSGKLSYGDYAKARQSYVNSWNDLASKDRSFYDLLVPYLRDYFGGGMDEYSAMRQRAQEWGFTQEQVDSLTSEQLNYIKSLGADTEKVFTSFAAFLADFAKYQTQVETSYDGLKTKWDKATEAQTAAQEVMTATDSNGGVLTQENYNKLIGANKAYGAAVTTIGGVTTIDSDKLNSGNL